MTPTRSQSETPGRAVVALSECAAGCEARLTAVRAGRELRARLAAMGLAPGVRLRVVRQSGRGPMVLAVRGMRLAVGRGMAEKLDVEPEAAS